MWSCVGNAPALSKRHWPRGLVYDSWMGKTLLNGCPPQWIAGLYGSILSPVFHDSPCIMYPSDVANLTPDVFKKIMSMNKVDGIKCPPHTIVTLYEDAESKAMLRSMEYVVYLGAPLDRSVGDDLCQYTRLSPMIGSTECGDQVSIRPAARNLWYTHDYVPENGHKMVTMMDRVCNASEGIKLSWDIAN